MMPLSLVRASDCGRVVQLVLAYRVEHHICCAGGFTTPLYGLLPGL